MDESRSSESGFSIIEVLISVGLLAVLSLGVAQLLALSTTANFRAKGQTSTAMLAAEKMEQLRGLTWGYDVQQAGLGLPVSDTTTDLTVEPPTALGTGLNPSPAGTLDTNTPGFVDYLDENGRWVGTGAGVPANARFVRRWSIDPLPTNPNNVLVFQVLVRRLAEGAGGGLASARMLGETRLVSVKSRKAF